MEGRKTIFSQYREVEDIKKEYTYKSIIAAIPPWLLPPINVNMELSRKITKKTDSTSVLRQYTFNKISTFKGYIEAYTDGSKTPDKNVGSAA